jgi:hypothetical protein
MIGKAIERMDKASYALKALSPAAIGVAFVLIERRVPTWLALSGAAVVVLIYWILDAEYLRRERGFRSLFDLVRHGKLDDDPYVMEIGLVVKQISTWRCMLATTTLGVHGAALLVMLIALITKYWPVHI